MSGSYFFTVESLGLEYFTAFHFIMGAPNTGITLPRKGRTISASMAYPGYEPGAEM